MVIRQLLNYNARHKKRVFTYNVLIVKNHHLAEDIFQDTFIKVIRSLKSGKYTEMASSFPGHFVFHTT